MQTNNEILNELNKILHNPKEVENIKKITTDRGLIERIKMESAKTILIEGADGKQLLNG